MVLFYGELLLSGARHFQRTLPEPINDSAWQKVTAQNITIHICDFSSKKNRCLLNEQYAAAISGDPVVTEGQRSNNNSLTTIAEEFLLDRVDCIKAANGVFCGFYLDKLHSRIKLFTDYLGLRKILIAKLEDRIVFSNTQWLIERLLPDSSEFDEQAIIEIGTLGYALENRTRRKKVELLPPGSLMTIDNLGVSSVEQIHTIVATQPVEMSENDALDAIRAVWNRAVADRIDNENPVAFLSGGMDSRLIVHTLKELGTKPHTANFAPPNTMDRVFAENAARELGVPLWLHPTGSLNTDFVVETVNAWTNSSIELTEHFQDRKIWSGDGGSVGLGNVYLDDEMSRLCHFGQFDECSRRFCSVNKRIPVARAYRRKNIQAWFEDTISRMLQSYSQSQPTKAPYFLLMLNDQRRHLDHHYETMHLRQFDFKLPFFDRRFIELISALTSHQFNYHIMYDKLFRKIGGKLTATPWQTYPGHVECPLAIPDGLAYQWGGSFYSNNEKKRLRRTNALRSLRFAANPPTKQLLFNRTYIAAASAATILGISDHSYIYQCVKPCI